MAKSPVARSRAVQRQLPMPRAGSQCIKPDDSPIRQSTNLFFNYLPPSYTDADLRALCAQFGDIYSSKIMINLETGESKCFGFARFATLAQAQAAIQSLNGMVLQNKKLLVKYAESREKSDRESPLIYVKQIPMNMNPGSVAELFRRFGPIVSVVPHMIDPIDPNVWRCFVQYGTVVAAAAAVSEMNNKVVAAGARPIHVCFGDPQILPAPNVTQVHVEEIDERTLLPSFLMV